MLLSGLGLLAVNHEFARKWLHYARKHSQSINSILFPNIRWVKITWDAVALALLIGGVLLNLQSEWWLLHGLSIGIVATSSTIFMLNRNRLAKLDNLIRRKPSSDNN